MGMEGLLEKVTTAACTARVEFKATIVLSGQGAGETLTRADQPTSAPRCIPFCICGRFGRRIPRCWKWQGQPAFTDQATGYKLLINDVAGKFGGL